MLSLGRLISHNGGFFNSALVILRRDDLKLGRFVGGDSLGNRYFENNYYFIGKNRWVAYADRFGFDYDGSCVDPQWFRWLHNMTDLFPYEEPNREIHRWMLPPQENKTGTPEEYVPYSTTTPKILPWTPLKPCFARK